MLDRTHRAPARFGPLALLASLSLLAGSALADDSDLFIDDIPPNVVMMIDSSGSMREVMYPPAYDPADSTCAIFDRIAPNSAPPTPEDGTGDKSDDDSKLLAYNCDANTNHCRFEIDKDHADFVATDTVSCHDGSTESNGYIERTFCGKTRKLYVDGQNECVGSDTWYSEWFVEWYFSPAADAHLIGNETNTSTDVTKIDANDNGINFLSNATYPLYKRSRISAAKLISKEVIYQTNSTCGAGAAATCTSYSDRVRFGIAEFDGKDGGFLSAKVDDYSTNRNAIEDALDDMEPDGSTPLAESLFKIYTYFMSRTDSEIPVGDDTSTKFPKYVYRESDGENDSSNAPGDPIECPNGATTCPCQKHFVIAISDGDPFNDHFTLNGDETEGFDDFQALIGDYHADMETEEGHLNNGTLYLDDIAKYMQENDFRPLDSDQEGVQNVDVYTVGFHLGPASLGGALLQKTADVGNGKAFFGTQAGQIRTALVASIAEIIEKTQSFTAATVPASRTTDGDNFYSTYFRPRQDSPFWDGHLKNFKFTLTGDILTEDDKCVVGTTATSPPCANSGPLRTSAEAVWDAADEMPDPIDRKLFVGGTGSYGAAPPAWFTPGSPATTTMTRQDLGLTTAPHTRLEEKPYELPNPPSNADLDALAQDLVGNLAGCVFGTDLGAGCTTRTNQNAEKSILGDIFHSNPLVVSSPNARINDATYHEFAHDFRTRDQVIYAGSNDGWVHGFLAGEWQTDDGGSPASPLIPPRHDRGDRSGNGGKELFGFMPSVVRDKIWELPLSMNGGGARDFYGPDGTAVAADVWIYRSVSGSGDFGSVLSTPTSFPGDKLKEQWRTVLIGGLREGGNGYYALDVTDPSGSTYNYPGYLWEFPCDDCGSAVNPGSAAAIPALGLSPSDYLGETWSDPVITRVRVAVNGEAGAHERWVAIVGGGYDVCGDPNHASYTATLAGQACDAASASSRRGRAILMIDITTGELLASKFYHPTDVPASPPSSYDQLAFNEMKYAFASQPAVFDLNFDGYGDVVYIGDLGGQLWKWVISPVGHDPINNSGSDDELTQPNWPFYVLFEADDHSAVHYQSFFYPPTAALRGGTLTLAFGAGERADTHAGSTDAVADDYLDTDNNHYYVVKDADPFVQNPISTLTDAPPPVPAGDLVPIDLVDSGSNSCVDVANADGFFLTGRDREKFVTNSVIFLGEVITGSFVPADPSTSSCDSKGQAFLYRFDLHCGAGAYPSNPGTEADKRRKAIGGGLPSRPRVSVGELNSGGGGGGCANKVVLITSEGGVENDCPGPLPSSGIDVRTWRAR